MAHVHEAPPPRGKWPPRNPWTFLGVGAGATLLGWVFLLPGVAVIPLGALLVTVGVVAAVGAIAFRLRAAGDDFESRLRTAGIVALAAVIPFLATRALDQNWEATPEGPETNKKWVNPVGTCPDSIILVLGVVTTVL